MAFELRGSDLRGVGIHKMENNPQFHAGLLSFMCSAVGLHTGVLIFCPIVKHVYWHTFSVL